MPKTYPVPTDLDAPDHVFQIRSLKVGWTARQFVLLFLPLMAVAAGLTYITYQLAGRGRVGLIAAALPLILIGGTAIAAPSLSFEGLKPEQALVAAVRFVRQPRRLVWAPHGLVRLRKVKGVTQPRRGAMPVLWGRTEGSDVKSDAWWVRGFAVGATDFGLASEREQEVKIRAWRQLINSMEGSFQILVQAHPIDVEVEADKVEAVGLTTPALAEAAKRHAAHLRSMQGSNRRQVYLVIRGKDRSQLDLIGDALGQMMQPMALPLRKLSGDELTSLLEDAAGGEIMGGEIAV